MNPIIYLELLRTLRQFDSDALNNTEIYGLGTAYDLYENTIVQYCETQGIDHRVMTDEEQDEFVNKL